jgi:hypothetical protein
MVARSTAFALAATLALCGCGDSAAQPAPEESAAAVVASVAPSSSAVAPPAVDAEHAQAWQACKTQIDAAKAEPALPGAPEFEKVRVHMARVRGRPAYWRKSLPRPAKLQDVLDKNDTAPKVATALRNLIRKTKQRAKRQELLLREGYLWDDDVHMAIALNEQVSLANLFKEPALHLQRGVDVYELERVPKTRYLKERYLYKDGPLAGKRAEILVGDRIATDRAELSDDTALAIDLQDLLAREHFDRIKPTHLSKAHLVADVRYGAGNWAPALFNLKGSRAELVCEVLTPALTSVRTAFIADQEILRKAMARVSHVIREMVLEEIPFDADTGQTMGFLRKEWRRAYDRGWRKFDYEGKLRRVYNDDGAPIPPQVCIDFLTDTWERAAGTWYAPAAKVPSKRKGKFKLETSPKRTKGAIDLDDLQVGNRRSVAKFTKFTEAHSDLFDVWPLPKHERYPFKDRERFFNYLHEKADMFRPGDMITVHGYKEGGRPHYHSLIVLEQDPITGVIIRVAGNAVFPREQTLEGIMYISPKRSIRHRIRVKAPWLKSIAGQADIPLGG